MRIYWKRKDASVVSIYIYLCIYTRARRRSRSWRDKFSLPRVIRAIKKEIWPAAGPSRAREDVFLYQPPPPPPPPPLVHPEAPCAPPRYPLARAAAASFRRALICPAAGCELSNDVVSTFAPRRKLSAHRRAHKNIIQAYEARLPARVYAYIYLFVIHIRTWVCVRIRRRSYTARSLLLETRGAEAERGATPSAAARSLTPTRA